MLARLSHRLAIKRQHEEEEKSQQPHSKATPSDDNKTPKKKRKTAAEATRDWKERMKTTDPVKYEDYKEKRRLQSKASRQNMTEEDRAKVREQAKLRMQAKRLRDKMGLNSETPVKTRASQEQQRLKWREKKQLQRANLSSQKVRRINEKRREKYRQSHSENQKRTEKTCNLPKNSDLSLAINSNEEQSVDFEPADARTPSAKRKARSRALSAMPNGPRKFFHTVYKAMAHYAPAAARKLIIASASTIEHQIGKSLLQKLKATNKVRSKEYLSIRRVLLSVCGKYGLKSSSQLVGVSRKTLSAVSSDGLITPKEGLKKTKKMEEEATEFFEACSHPVPDKKKVSTKSGKAMEILSKPLKDLYDDFSVQHPGISFSHFAKCRPHHIKLMANSLLRMCLCEYCTNCNMKLRVVNRLAAQINNNCRIRHVYHAVDLVTCGRQEGKLKKSCVYRDCAECSTNDIRDHLQPLLQHQGPITWMKWESQMAEVNGKRISRKLLIRKSGTMGDLVTELHQELIFLGGHLFRADWQHSQFELFRKAKPFPQRTVGMVLDFAENYMCSYQDEVQAAHWHHEQVTVHPIVAYYACPRCAETATESIVCISDDRVHDFSAVHQFTKLAINHLRGRGLNVEEVIQWTDGCASQYKSRGPFSDISHSMLDHGCRFERHYFGSRHGKGPSDGESAVIKHSASVAVKTSRAVITSARDLFEYCVGSKLNKQPSDDCSEHFFRTFFFVESSDIDRNRDRPVKTLRGSRSLHAVKGIQENSIETRQLSCLCNPCKNGFAECANMDIVGPWQLQRLQPAGLQRAPLHQPAPEPAPRPAPEPAPQPALEPAPQPTPEPAPQPTPTLEPAPQPTPEPAPQPTPEPAPQPTSEPAPLPQPALQVGGFIRVELEGKNRKVPFYAKIIEIDCGTNDLKVLYLKQRPDTNTYVWAEEAWLTAEQQVVSVLPPSLAPGRGVAFVF